MYRSFARLYIPRTLPVLCAQAGYFGVRSYPRKSYCIRLSTSGDTNFVESSQCQDLLDLQSVIGLRIVDDSCDVHRSTVVDTGLYNPGITQDDGSA